MTQVELVCDLEQGAFVSPEEFAPQQLAAQLKDPCECHARRPLVLKGCAAPAEERNRVLDWVAGVVARALDRECDQIVARVARGFDQAAAVLARSRQLESERCLAQETVDLAPSMIGSRTRNVVV